MAAPIRPIRPADAAACLAIARDLREWFNDEGLGRMGRDLLSHEGLVADVAGAVAGFVTWAPADDPGVAEITWLALARAHHRHGIGGALVTAAELELRGRGHHGVVVATLADTIDYPPYEGTRRFYLRRGYQRVRVDPGYWGEGNDRLLLRLDFTAREPHPWNR